MRSPSRFVWRAAGLAWTIAMAFGPNAGAVSRYPGSMRSHFTPQLGYTPPCGLCHIQGTTGSGSVATPFGISMLAHGLTSDRSTLTPALDALQSDNIDSDGDGVSDIDELIANTDPNTPADVPLSGSDPTYGCAVARGPLNSRVAGWPLLAMAVGVTAGFRRRRAPGSRRAAVKGASLLLLYDDDRGRRRTNPRRRMTCRRNRPPPA